MCRRPPRVHPPLSRLGRFMKENRVTTAELTRRSGLSRRFVNYLRTEKGNPSLTSMKYVAGAMSDIVGSRVHLGELFDLDYETFDDVVTNRPSN